MSGGYPARAYRNGAGRRQWADGGSQSPSEFPTAPKPANDNYPRPANDNQPTKKNPFAGRGWQSINKSWIGILRFIWNQENAGRNWYAQEPTGSYSLHGWSNTINCNPLRTLGPFPRRLLGCVTFAPPKDTMGDPPFYLSGFYYYTWSGPGNYYFASSPETHYQCWPGQTWRIPGTFPTLPRPIWNNPPLEIPVVNPAVDPFALPIQAPVEAPQPLPWKALPQRRQNPYRSPNESPQRGPQPRTRPIPEEGPWASPGPELQLDPQLGGRLAPNGHMNRKPPDKTREKKAKGRAWASHGGAAGRGIVRLFGGATEVGDASEAIWDALPEKFRKKEMAKRHGKKPKILDQIGQIIDNFDDIDAAEAAANLIENELKDRAIGKWSKATNKGAAWAGMNRGLTGGPWSKAGKLFRPN